jgi:hypothetical protein
MPPENDTPHGLFKNLLAKLSRVPKREIDEQEKRDTRNRERRKNPRPAKPGQIASVPESNPR